MGNFDSRYGLTASSSDDLLVRKRIHSADICVWNARPAPVLQLWPDVHFVLRMLHVDQKSPVPWVHCRKQRIPGDWVRWLKIWQCIPVVVTPGQAQDLRADVAWRDWWDDLSCVKFSGGWPWALVTCPEDLVAHHWTGGWFCSQRPFLHLHPSPTSADIPDWGGLLTSSGQRSWMWLTILHCAGQSYNKGQWAHMLTVPRVRKTCARNFLSYILSGATMTIDRSLER